jgi:hypothetical protein
MVAEARRHGALYTRGPWDVLSAPKPSSREPRGTLFQKATPRRYRQPVLKLWMRGNQTMAGYLEAKARLGPPTVEDRKQEILIEDDARLKKSKRDHHWDLIKSWRPHHVPGDERKTERHYAGGWQSGSDRDLRTGIRFATKILLRPAPFGGGYIVPDRLIRDHCAECASIRLHYRPRYGRNLECVCCSGMLGRIPGPTPTIELPQLSAWRSHDARLRAAINGDAQLATLGVPTRDPRRAPYVREIEQHGIRCFTCRRRSRLRLWTLIFDAVSQALRKLGTVRSWWPDYVLAQRRKKSIPRAMRDCDRGIPDIGRDRTHASESKQWLKKNDPAPPEERARTPRRLKRRPSPRAWLDPNRPQTDQLLGLVRSRQAGKP